MIATDGHRLGVIGHQTNHPGADYPCKGYCPAQPDEKLEPVIVPLDAVKEWAKSIPKAKTMAVLEHVAINVHATNANGTIEAFTTDLENVRQHNARKIDGKFPNYQNVIPSGNPVAYTHVNAEYLMQLGKAFKDAGMPVISIQLNGPLSPMKFTGENLDTGQKATAVLMPVKGYTIDTTQEPKPE